MNGTHNAPATLPATLTTAAAIRRMMDELPGEFAVDYANGQWTVYSRSMQTTATYAVDGTWLSGERNLLVNYL